uniref:Sperm-tail PG-rich repeat containing 4 n=1 Tax=Sphenodon punctatus TaxID=8508 RepID=A0A8D0G574_SPHPU
PPFGKRDTWWRLSLRPTPVPGSYAVRDFLEEAELNPVKTTYNFRGEGRKRPSIFQPMVDPTLPDVYMYIPPSFVDLAKKKSATYSFKSTARPSPTTLCYKDKKTPGPGTYWPTRQFPKQPRTIASLGCEHSIFFSNTSGF